MTDLREKLQAAKDAYAQAKYPGALANDVRPAMRGSPWKLAFATLASAAAMLFLGITFWPTIPRGDPVAAVEQSAEVNEVKNAGEAPELSGGESESESYSYVIDDVPMLPAIGSLWASHETAGEEFAPLVPSFPSMTELAAAETEAEITEGELR